jgi:hypothetical protein
MKLPKSLNSILQNVSLQFSKPRPTSFLYNRWVLYLVFAISLFQLYTFSVAGKLQNVAVFLLVAFLTSFFSKNMTVIMVIALVFTELLSIGFNISRLEGMTDGTEGTKETKTGAESSTESGSAEIKPTKEENDKKEGSGEKDKNPTPNPEEVKKTQEELQDNLNKINEGFEKIEPFMLKAEGLVNKMNSFAKA